MTGMDYPFHRAKIKFFLHRMLDHEPSGGGHSFNGGIKKTATLLQFYDLIFFVKMGGIRLVNIIKAVRNQLLKIFAENGAKLLSQIHRIKFFPGYLF